MISRLIRILFLAGITLPPLAQAAISGIQVTCTDPQNPDTCTVETIGDGAIPPSSQMLTFIEQLIRSTIDPTSPNPDCNLTVLAGGLTTHAGGLVNAEVAAAHGYEVAAPPVG